MAIRYSNWNINRSVKARLTPICQSILGINKTQKQKIFNPDTCYLIILR